MTTPPDPRDARIIAWLRERRPGDEPTFSVDAGWSRFVRTHDLRNRPRPIRRVLSPVAWRIAAALIVMFAGVGAGAWRWIMHRGADPFVEQVVANGQRRTITLADGSLVTLNGGSRLRVGARMDTGARDVYLDGEAFFVVRHEPRRAFRVHAKDGTIEDVGTRFTVRAYAAQADVEVAVAEGVVTLASASRSGAPLTLKAGDVAVLEPSGIARRATSQSLDRYVGWTRGELVLDRVPLRDALADLEHAYGVRIAVRDTALERRPVSARFHGESIRQVLDAIVVALDAAYEAHDSTFVVRAKGGPDK
jgi:ferric-dicitrate binding protein FerR (iron transport regulator)